MSWLPRSIANSLLIDGEDEDEDDRPTVPNDGNDHHPQFVTEQLFNPNQDGSDPQTLTTGVKGDLSEFTESLARQLWGVASFLAPPPPPPPPPPPLPPIPLRHSSRTTTQPDTSDSIRKDSSVSGDEDGDDVSNSICADSRFGGETGVSNSSTFSNGNQEEKDDNAFVGVTEEVLAFAMNIAHHPETWLDFPLSEEEESDDFEMSDTQWNHATLVEHLTPRLAALRMELCPIHMSESYFWKVYFVLLHSRLNKHDANLLSTPQIVAARSMWMKELQMQMKIKPDLFEGNGSRMLDCHQDFGATATSSDFPASTTHHTVEGKQPVLEIDEPKGAVVPPYMEDFDDDEDDDWVHENNSELDGYNGTDDVPVGAHEDISFSDLEDDDCTMPIRSKLI